jgi:putative transposase
VLTEAEEDVLAYMAFSRAHRARIFSTNVLERLNREVKRRTEMVGLFPDVPSVIRLVGIVLLEIDDEWQVERRYFSQESMRKLTEPPTGPAAPSSPPRVAPVR